MSKFLHRGIVEGFYGVPFSHEDRLWWIEELGRMGMNRYVYAPKDDSCQRSEWREPYGESQLAEFRDLVTSGGKVGVEVGFAISPGLSISYSSKRDRIDLIRKIKSFYKLGARFFCLGLDDVPSELIHTADRKHFESLAQAHISAANEVLGEISDGGSLWIIPTEYLGIDSTPYLQMLGEHLHPRIEIAWTGRTVISPNIELSEAKHRSQILRRPIVIWDNVPVNDGPMNTMLHLGPYQGRDPNLPESVSGILLNVMPQARASAVCVRTASEYFRNPKDYDAEAAWIRAIHNAGSGAKSAFRTFAEAHRFSPVAPCDRDNPLENTFRSLKDSSTQAGIDRVRLKDLETLLKSRLSLADILRTELLDRSLLSEIEPWIESHHQETEMLFLAVELLKSMDLDVSRMEKIKRLFRFQMQIRNHNPLKVSYGPRRVLYPQLTKTGDETAAFGNDLALFRDYSLVEEFVRYAEDQALLFLQAE